MSEKKNWGDKVVGWFIEQEEEASPKSAEEVLAEVEAGEPAAAAPAPVKLEGEVAAAAAAPGPGGGFDFAAVYRAAGISPEAQDRVQKAIALLQELPPDSPGAVKRQIVEASLKAFGYPVEQIVEAGETEIRALEAFIDLGERNIATTVEKSNERIEELTAEIAMIKEKLEQKLSAQKALGEHCNEQKERVRQVLGFFGGEDTAGGVAAASPPPEDPAPAGDE